MTPLSSADFGDFFEALHGVAPFPWQRRLMSNVVSTGWPAAIALPTASGKTACIDVAVFHLALDAGKKLGERRAGMRVAFVIDRRVVVDEAFERARHIAEKLGAARNGVLAVVADRLRSFSGDEEPLACAVLRGGMYRDERWARTPCQPTVVVSTVDQVGSRLLFRGYGISPRATPIHAGLIGNDAVVIVDEAHCARPFVETLNAVARYRAWGAGGADPPFHIVRMSATQPSADAFVAHDEDRMHPVLGARLNAAKHARLLEVRGRDRDSAMVDALVDGARGLAAGMRSVGVMVNRVAMARRVHERLQEDGDGDASVVLLTGRVRPRDRDVLVRFVMQRVGAGAARGSDATAPVFVVATQCLEVGANLDFDALVTECASLDALRQRFGRLDRLGARRRSEALIVAHEGDIAIGTDDPVYGGALAATWSWLRERASDEKVDFGVSAMDAHLAATEDIDAVVKPSPSAPCMLPAYIDIWCQTSPVPTPSPDVASFLHGPERSTDVHVVWRADLADAPEESWADVVAQLPPSSAEALPLPIHIARAWLEGLDPGDAADVEGMRPVGVTDLSARGRPVLRWDGPDDSEIVDSGMIRPGDVLVVPASYGGCDQFGWNPASTSPVEDLGERAHLAARSRAALRLHSAFELPFAVDAMIAEQFAALAVATEPPESDEVIDSLLANLAGTFASDLEMSTIVSALRRSRGRKIVMHASGRGLVVTSARRVTTAGAPTDFSDEDDWSSSTVAVSLASHSGGVRDRARRYAEALGLPQELVDDLALAGFLHDAGKADPRFQAWLHGGDRVASRGTLLAKAAVRASNRRAQAAARRRSGYPEGGRHELLSVRLAESSERLPMRAHDWDLVLYLIGSHHGFCRPFAPVIDDGDPRVVNLRHGDDDLAASSATGLERLDSGTAERFWGLVRRHGPWRLAWLEAILRLADHRQSEWEEARAESEP